MDYVKKYKDCDIETASDLLAFWGEEAYEFVYGNDYFRETFYELNEQEEKISVDEFIYNFHWEEFLDLLSGQ